MSFDIALTGLNAASKHLDVTANNIANVGTTGFKRSRSEFSDVFASSLTDASAQSVGSGVKLSKVNQQFSQGNVSLTNNSLDLAINGDGFFTLASADRGLLYSRAGAFSRQSLGKSDQVGLAGTIERVTSAAGYQPGQRRDVQYPAIALLPHCWQQSIAQLNRCHHHQLYKLAVILPVP